MMLVLRFGSRLFSEDYVKLRGLLLFRLLSTLVDADNDVRELGLRLVRETWCQQFEIYSQGSFAC